jgi:phosphoribosyl-ATP pyrophosphohydrolase
VHHQGFFAHSQHFLRIIAIERHDGRLVYHYFVVMDYQGIGGTQVYRDLLRKPVKKSHAALLDL